MGTVKKRTATGYIVQLHQNKRVGKVNAHEFAPEELTSMNKATPQQTAASSAPSAPAPSAPAPSAPPLPYQEQTDPASGAKCYVSLNGTAQCDMPIFSEERISNDDK